MYEPCPGKLIGPPLVLISQLHDNVLSCVPSKRTPPTMWKRLKSMLSITYPAVTRSTKSKLLLLPPKSDGAGAVWGHTVSSLVNRSGLALKNDCTPSQLTPGP